MTGCRFRIPVFPLPVAASVWGWCYLRTSIHCRGGQVTVIYFQLNPDI